MYTYIKTSSIHFNYIQFLYVNDISIKLFLKKIKRKLTEAAEEVHRSSKTDQRRTEQSINKSTR